ncbi:hypothetical protein OBBRIDRAFT_887032 [Obba rivulosa]|uniref:Mixed lineage kinase domain-containing protein n=1 Tax=Obba rivulosa TaxID=1052685 RepID=A0A8E2B4B3_9APHY|nr:hypothetical protein OBBRIDRAFT_887032 [Obba rivulosa]
MPLRYIRSKVTAGAVLNVAITTTSVTKELADILQFPPASAAAALLLCIFETIQSLQTNRSECYRLARRCLSLLTDVRDSMDGRWEDAPESLLRVLKKFERTLESIHEYMQGEAENKWRTRFVRKSSIEEALAHYNRELDDAARSFQVATLINIHYSVGDRARSTTALTMEIPGITATTVDVTPVPPYDEIAENNVVHITEAVEFTQSPVSRQGSKDSESYDLVNPVPIPGTRNSSRSEEYVLVDTEYPRGISQPSSSAESYPTASLAMSSSTSTSSVMTPISLSITDAVPAAVMESPSEEDFAILNHHGFRKYHQSEVILKGKSKIKQGWWAGATVAQVDGQKSLVKRYEGRRDEATKKWLRDVKILQNVFHPNLPQMVGYSYEETPTPFILLANVQTRLPQALILDAVEKSSLAFCAQTIIRFYRDTMDAALYLQRQMNLSDSKIQDYVENASFRIDAEQTLIMGLPPPEVDNWVSYRNFGLAHSIRSIYLKILPNRGIARQPYDINDTDVSNEVQKKLSHLAVLANALLSSSSNIDAVQARLQEILQDEEEYQPRISLRQLRMAALRSDIHQTWRQSTVPAYKYAVGDLGYIPAGGGFDSFTVLCNVLRDGLTSFDINTDAEGIQIDWKGGFVDKQDLQPFCLPGDIRGWTVVVPPAAEYNVQITHEAFVSSSDSAWRYLLDHGKELAKTHGIAPEELILVTKVGVDLRFKIHDLRQIHHFHQPASHRGSAFSAPGFSQFGHQNHAGFGGAPFGHSPFGHQQHHHMHMRPFPGQDLSPSVFYLFTAMDKDHEPYWSETPFYTPLPKGAPPPEMKAKCFAGLEWTYGYMNYVQLHAEDFE